ncbi:MAG: hypothetical protein GX628_00030 [Clostridiales bacterium]|nr:hypothetical protein [Clostridiales bacterium]
MKKGISLLLALLILTLTPVFTYCGSAETQTDVTEQSTTELTEAETTVDYLETLPKEDFNGAVYTIAAQSTEQRPNLPAEEENGEILNDSLIQRNRAVSERYNIEIASIIYPGKTDPANAVQKAVLANDYLCDLVICYIASGGMSTIAQGGYLYDLADIDMLSLGENWWCASFYDDVNINGSLYFTTGPLSPSFYYAPHLFVYNLTLAEAYNLPDMVSVVLDGDYTFDYFTSLTKDVSADIDGDGAMTAADLFAVTHTGDGRGPLYGLGGSFSSRASDGSLVLDLENSALVGKIQLLYDFMSDKITCFSDNTTVKALTMFQSDRALFFLSAANNIITGYSDVPSCREMESDYGFLPMPKQTESQEGYYTCSSVHMPTGIGIPLVIEDPHRTGLVTETLAYLSYNSYVREAAYEKVVKAKVAREQRHEEVLDLIYAGVRFDNNYIMDFGCTCVLMADCSGGANPNYVSSIAAKLPAAEKAMNDYIALFSK